MTSAESTLTARGSTTLRNGGRFCGWSRRRASFAFGAVAFCLTGGLLAPFAATPAASGSSSVSTLQDKAAAIAQRIDTLQTKLQILSEEYDQANERSSALRKQVNAEQTQLGKAEGAVSSDGKRLRRQAIEAYVSGGSAAGLSSVLSSNANALPQQQAYLSAASGGLDSAISALQDSEHRLSVRKSTLSSDQQKASQTTKAIGSEKQAAESLTNQLTAAESSVKGQLANAVRAQEAAQEAAAQRAARAEAVAAANQPPPPAPTPIQSSGASTPTTSPAATPSAPTSSGGGAAVAAAESQIGVPYVWAAPRPARALTARAS